MFIIIVFWLGSNRPSGLFFRARFSFFNTHASLLTFLVRFFILFHSCCSMRERLWKHSCISSPFPVSILDGTLFFSFCENNE